MLSTCRRFSDPSAASLMLQVLAYLQLFSPSPLMLTSRVSLVGVADRQRFKPASGCICTKTAVSAHTVSCGIT